MGDEASRLQENNAPAKKLPATLQICRQLCGALGIHREAAGLEGLFRNRTIRTLATLGFSYVAGEQHLELVSQLLWQHVFPVVEPSYQNHTASGAPAGNVSLAVWPDLANVDQTRSRIHSQFPGTVALREFSTE
jgi:hypothetical protein